MAGQPGFEILQKDDTDGNQLAAKVRAFVALTQRKRALKAELDKVNGELRVLDELITESFGQDGIHSQKISVDGTKYTVYIATVRRAKITDGDYEAACSALKRAGLADIVHETVNLNTLSAWCRERLAAGEELPDFRGRVTVDTSYELRAMRA